MDGSAGPARGGGNRPRSAARCPMELPRTGCVRVVPGLSLRWMRRKCLRENGWLCRACAWWRKSPEIGSPMPDGASSHGMCPRCAWSVLEVDEEEVPAGEWMALPGLRVVEEIARDRQPDARWSFLARDVSALCLVCP